MPPKKKDNKVHPEPQASLPLQRQAASQAILVSLRHVKTPKRTFERESALALSAAQKLAHNYPPGVPGTMPFRNFAARHEKQWLLNMARKQPQTGKIWEQIAKSTIANQPETLKHINDLSVHMKRMRNENALEAHRLQKAMGVVGYIPPIVELPEYKNGGLVKKTGLAKAHAGELVIPASRVKSIKAAVKKAGLKALKE